MLSSRQEAKPLHDAYERTSNLMNTQRMDHDDKENNNHHNVDIKGSMTSRKSVKKACLTMDQIKTEHKK